MASPRPLSCIRRDHHDLQDATALAEQVLGQRHGTLDNTTFQFSRELFIAVALLTAYSKPDATTDDMINFLADPRWEMSQQALFLLANDQARFQHEAAATWHQGFAKKVFAMTPDRADSLVRQCLAQWRDALGMTGTARKPRSQARVQVFEPQSITKALGNLSHLKDEKRLGLAGALENALVDDGFRSLPNARKASVKLETAKAMFENLAEPIARLQMDLILAAAMNPKEFHVTPLLLLGEPGIGKTYFASQVASALGSASNKLSAGGAQGGFQLTGSHSSYTDGKPGAIFTLLAEGQSAAPVMVIDEVDKIHDRSYPVLPVLLDLLEPRSAREFKDEFFETTFDASRMVVALTANTLDGVPAPLLSRVEVINVPSPEPSQRLRIIQQEAAQWCKKTRRLIDFREADCRALSERMDIDLRKLTRVVKESFAKAIQQGETTAHLVLPKAEGRRSIGFTL